MLAFLYLEFHAVTPLRLEVANDIGHLPSTPTAPSCRIGTQALRIRTATEAAVNELLHDHVRKSQPTADRGIYYLDASFGLFHQVNVDGDWR
jgi:hypothetical protein